MAGLGLGTTAGTGADPGRGDPLGELVADSVAAVARTSGRGRVIALLLGGVATLLAAGLTLAFGASGAAKWARAAAELDATLWERRAQRRRPNTPPP